MDLEQAQGGAFDNNKKMAEFSLPEEHWASE